MLPDKVKQFLSITRGVNGYEESYDKDVDEFTKRYKKTLDHNFIKVVMINSPLAKSQMLECDNENYLIWDCSFFDNVRLYILHILSIKCTISKIENTSYKNQKQNCQDLMRIIWHYLFKHQIQNISYANQQQKEVLDNYCTKTTACSNAFTKISIDMQNLLNNIIYYAKYYIFCHEMAHITYQNDVDYLNTVFDIAQSVLNKTQDKPSYFSLIEKEVDTLNRCNNYNDFSFYQEIMADTRAVQTTWSGLIYDLFGQNKTVLTDEEMHLLFPKLLETQYGIDLVRSFLVRSSNLRYLICSLLSAEADNSVFINFLVRDYFSNPINIVLLTGFDNNTGRGLGYMIKFDQSRCDRNIPIIDDLFTDEFAHHILQLKKQLSI